MELGSTFMDFLSSFSLFWFCKLLDGIVVIGMQKKVKLMAFIKLHLILILAITSISMPLRHARLIFPATDHAKDLKRAITSRTKI